MNNIIPFITLLFFSAMLMFYIASFSWKKRTISGAKPLTMLALCVFIWTSAYAFEIMNPTLSWMLFWDKVKFLGMSFASTALLLFVLEYAGYEKWMQRRFILPLVTISALVYFLNLTNSWHHWIYLAEPHIDQTFLPALVFEYQTLGWVQIGYGLLLSGLSGLILIHQYFHTSKVYRPQILIIITGLTVPMLGIVLALVNIIPFAFIDFSAFLLVISGLILCIGLFRYGLLDLSPITHTAVLDSIQDGVIVVDVLDRILEINPSAATMLNLDNKKRVGKALSQVWLAWESLADECEQNGEVTFEVGQETNTTRYFNLRCKPIENAQQHRNGLLLVIHDNTDHVLAEKLILEKAALLEDEVASQKAEIHVAQEKSDIVLRSIQDAIGMADLNGVINYVNSSFAQLTGYEQDELLGMEARYLLDEGANEGAIESMWQSIDEAILQHCAWQGEMQFLRKNGSSYVADVLLAPVYDDLGQLIGYISSHRDVSKQKKLEKARTQFINNISHELRTPVTNLKLYNELMQMNFPIEKQRDYQAIMVQQVERLEKVIQDVLEVSALDLDEMPFVYDEVDVQDLLETAVFHKQAQAEQKQILLTIESLTQKQIILGDFDQLEKAISKLLDNALIFTPENGTVAVRLTTTFEAEQNWINIAIEDDGPGIAEDEQAQIFHRFYRGTLAASGHMPGTGLGLSLAEQIVQLQGGEIVVSSEMGRGSTFTIKLPAVGELAR